MAEVTHYNSEDDFHVVEPENMPEALLPEDDGFPMLGGDRPASTMAPITPVAHIALNGEVSGEAVREAVRETIQRMDEEAGLRGARGHAFYEDEDNPHFIGRFGTAQEMHHAVLSSPEKGGPAELVDPARMHTGLAVVHVALPGMVFATIPNPKLAIKPGVAFAEAIAKHLNDRHAV